MILVPKPVQLPSNPPSSHRRHPSAPPAVIVQPTRIPGLLSLTKPLRPSPNRPSSHQQHSRQPRALKSKPATRPDSQETTSLKPSLDIIEKKTVTQTCVPPPLPGKNVRGRQHAKPGKDVSQKRSASQSSLRGSARRNNNRQPSPPMQSTSQAEGPIQAPNPNLLFQTYPRSRNPDANLFDPFVINSTSDTDTGSDTIQPSKPAVVRPAPKLTSPAGKLARRRQPTSQASSSPTPSSKAVPVTRTAVKPNASNVSRSDPVISHMPERATRDRPVVAVWDVFPVCDDSNEEVVRPTTPVRKNPVVKAGFDDGPRTAPLSSTYTFPFGGQQTPNSSPSPPSRLRRHQRTPSEGVFTMSFDDDVAPSRSSLDLDAVYGMFNKKRSSYGNSRVGADKAGYFASSTFQNSPNPEELPPPRFGAHA